MKILNFAKVSLLLVVLLTTNACSDRNYIDYRNTDEELCNKDWVQTKMDADGLKAAYKCILTFKENGKYDKTEIYYGADKTTRYEYNDLSWRWADESNEQLILTNKTVTQTFDNVMVRAHYLTGRLDGQEVMFTDYK